MTGFAEGTAQWLVDRRRLTGANEIAAVVSLSHRIRATPLQWAQRVHGDVLRVCPDVGKPVAWQAITEKRATIASRVGRVVPSQDGLNRYAIWLAGDWLHPALSCDFGSGGAIGRDGGAGSVAAVCGWG